MQPVEATLSGFVLTRQWREQDDGLSLLYWISTASGAVQVVLTHQETVCFLPRARRTDVERILAPIQGWRLRDLELMSFDHKPVSGLYVRSQRQLQRCRDLCTAAGIPLWEADIRAVDRYLSERFINGEICIQPNSDQQQSGTFINPRLTRGTRLGHPLRMVSLDIETAMDGTQLYSIGIYAADCARVWMRGEAQPESDTDIVWCDSERAVLQQFLAWLAQYDPDILIGWNVVNFDLRFLQQRCDQLRMALILGRNQELPEWRQARDESQHYFVLIPGRVVLDGIDTLKAATWNFESFSLEYVSRQLLDRGKLIHDVDSRGEEITELFLQDKLSLARYNLEDCRLVWDIFQKADLLQFALERSRLTGLQLDKVGGSVAAFENLYLPRLHRAGFVAPNIGELESDIAAPGGYVMDSRPGLYEHVLVLDFKSLYPSIIRTFCIDPLSLVEGLHDSQMPAALLKSTGKEAQIFLRKTSAPVFSDSPWVPGFNGAVFSKQQRVLPEIIHQLWDARDEAKKANNKPLSQAIKIIMNSFYGVLGTPLCRFFDPRLSSSITLRGHDILRQTRVLIEEQNYQVIYGDTDSVFVWLQGIEDSEQAHATGIKLARYLNDWWQQTVRTVFGLESCLELEYETHYRHFLMPTMRGSDAGSKKRYAGLIQSHNGEKLVFKGLEHVRTDWTPLARRVQYEVVWKIFHDEDVQQYLQSVVDDLLAGKLDQELLYRKRIRRRLAEYQKNIPPHAQAAKKADLYLQQHGRATRYGRGGWISYFITLNGAEPVECFESRLDYDHYLQRQLAPAVDGILHFRGLSLETIIQSQLPLF